MRKLLLVCLLFSTSVAAQVSNTPSQAPTIIKGPSAAAGGGCPGSPCLKVDTSNDPLTGDLQGVEGTATVTSYHGSDATSGIAFDAALHQVKVSANNGFRLVIDSGYINNLVPILSMDGTAATPSYGWFSGLSDKGFYVVGANEIGVSVTGIKRLGINATTIASATATGAYNLVHAAGAVAAPTYAFTGDTGTGIYRSAASTIALAIGGTQRWAITSAIAGTGGTGSANVVSAIGAVAAPSYSFVGDLTMGMYRTAASTLGFSTSSTLRLSMDTAAITSTLPHLNAIGTIAAPAYAFTGFTDAGLSYDNFGDTLQVANNTGNILVSASGAGSGTTVQSVGTLTLQTTGALANTILSATGSVLIGAGAGSGIALQSGTPLLGVVTTTTANVSGHFRMYGSDNATPGTKPTCTAKTDQAYGSMIYWNDNNDAVDGQMCMCNATNAAEAVAWRMVAAPATLCP